MSLTTAPRTPTATTPDRRNDRLAAVATTDPLDPGTFSGYSAALFSALTARGTPLVPIVSKRIRLLDVLDGALYLEGILKGRIRGRDAPLIDPDWAWSPSVLERASARVDARIAGDGGVTHALQIGTHVLIDHPGVAAYCVTDCTVTQALRAGVFAVSRTSHTGTANAVQWQKQVFDACTRIFTTSRWTADSVIGDFDQDPQRVVVVGAGANNVATPERGRTGPDPARSGPPTVLFVGYDWNLKGGPLLAEAWRIVHRRVPEARLVVVGCTPTIDAGGVEVLGRLDPRVPADRALLVDRYAAATCLALVSTFDAFPNVILEAAAAGVPTVAFDEQSRSEVVIDDTTGVLLDRRNPHDLADALCGLLTDPSRARRLGAAARTLVTAWFTWDAVAHRVADEMGLRT